jgi:hypothetical protein
MSSELSKPTFMLAALIGGVALFIAGFVIALEVRSTAASPAAATNGGGCYTNWNADTCAAGYAAVETGLWTSISLGGVICASEPTQSISGDREFHANISHTDNLLAQVNSQPCAICCASGAAVGGIGELPDVAGTGDGLARNRVIMAAVSAAIAFGAGAFYARRRWSRS